MKIHLNEDSLRIIAIHLTGSYLQPNQRRSLVTIQSSIIQTQNTSAPGVTSSVWLSTMPPSRTGSKYPKGRHPFYLIIYISLRCGLNRRRDKGDAARDPLGGPYRQIGSFLFLFPPKNTINQVCYESECTWPGSSRLAAAEGPKGVRHGQPPAWVTPFE